MDHGEPVSNFSPPRPNRPPQEVDEPASHSALRDDDDTRNDRSSRTRRKIVREATTTASAGLLLLPRRHSRPRARAPFGVADAAALVALAAAVYANTLHADFTFDDEFAIVSNAAVLAGARSHDAGAGSVWGNDFWGQNITSETSHKSWRPLTTLTFRLNARVAGLEHAEDAPGDAPAGRHPDDPERTDPTAERPRPRPRPFGFHAVNVLLHCVAVLLVHALCLRLAEPLFAEEDDEDDDEDDDDDEDEEDEDVGAKDVGPRRDPTVRRRRAFAWLAAALFAAHPVHAEAVASAVGRADVLAAVFALTAVLANADASARAGGESRGGRGGVFARRGFAAANVLLAALCKETGVCVVAPLVAWDALRVGDRGADSRRDLSGNSSETDSPKGSAKDSVVGGSALQKGSARRPFPRRFRRALGRVLAAHAPSFAAGLAYLIARRHVTRGGADSDSSSFSLSDRLVRKVENPVARAKGFVRSALAAGQAHAQYARLAFWPSALSCDWSHACLPEVTEWADPRNLAPLFLYAAALEASRRLLAGAAASRRASRAARWVAIASLAPLAPALHVVPGLVVGTFVAERLMYLPALGACVLFAFVSTTGMRASRTSTRRTRRRAERKKNEEAPSSSKKKKKPVAGTALACPLLRSFALLRSVFVPLFVLTLACARTTSRNVDWASDVALFASANATCPNGAKVRLNLGILARRAGDWATAEREFVAARRIEPGYCDPTYWRAVVALDRGVYERGAALLAEAGGCPWTAEKAAEGVAKVRAALVDDTTRAATAESESGSGSRDEGEKYPERRALAEAAAAWENAALLVGAATEEMRRVFEREGLDLNEDAFEEGSSARDRDPDFDFEGGRGRGTLARSFPPPGGDEPASPRSNRARCLSRRAALASALASELFRRAFVLAGGRFDSAAPPFFALPEALAADLHAHFRDASCGGGGVKKTGDPNDSPNDSPNDVALRVRLVHATQGADVEDPRGHAAWAEALAGVPGRAREAATHFAVAAEIGERRRIAEEGGGGEEGLQVCVVVCEGGAEAAGGLF